MLQWKILLFKSWFAICFVLPVPSKNFSNFIDRSSSIETFSSSPAFRNTVLCFMHEGSRSWSIAGFFLDPVERDSDSFSCLSKHYPYHKSYYFLPSKYFEITLQPLSLSLSYTGLFNYVYSNSRLSKSSSNLFRRACASLKMSRYRYWYRCSSGMVHFFALDEGKNDVCFARLLPSSLPRSLAPPPYDFIASITVIFVMVKSL